MAASAFLLPKLCGWPSSRRNYIRDG